MNTLRGCVEAAGKKCLLSWSLLGQGCLLIWKELNMFAYRMSLGWGCDGEWKDTEKGPTVGKETGIFWKEQQRGRGSEQMGWRRFSQGCRQDCVAANQEVTEIKTENDPSWKSKIDFYLFIYVGVDMSHQVSIFHFVNSVCSAEAGFSVWKPLLSVLTSEKFGTVLF